MTDSAATATAGSGADRSASTRRAPRGPASCARNRARGPASFTAGTLSTGTRARARARARARLRYPLPIVDPVVSIRATVARHLAQHGLRRAFIAFSGGPDSTVLADAAVAALGAPAVVLLHVDHGAAASVGAAAHCARFAAARGLELRTERIAVPAGASWEAQARVARYHALRALAGGTEELVLTAHTASDQAETVLLQLLRGTGPAGLAGVARRRGPFLRPLLDVARADVLTYLATAATDLTAWHDPMNEDVRFTRGRGRGRS